MLMNQITKMGAGILLMAFSWTSYADAPDPSEVYINNIVHAGTGCPSDTVAGDISEDGKAFTLLFDEYIVEAGPGIQRSKSRSFCQLTVNIHVPQGWSYTLFNVDYAGFADLERGTMGKQKTTYYFQGNRRLKESFQTIIRGEYSDDYEIHDEIELDDLVWSPCGTNRAINMKTDMQVRARRGKSALMTLDSIDGELIHEYGIAWRQCR